MSEVVALFSNESDAERAVSELYSRGYDAEAVGYVNRHRTSEGDFVTEETYNADDDMGETEKGVTGGAVGGAAVGAGTSLLASAGMLLIPGIGPFLAAGSLAATLAATAVGAAGGAAIGGAAGAIFGDDHDDEVTRRYRSGVEGGNALVTVHVRDGQRDTVVDILRTAGATDVDTYDDSGWVS